MWFKENIFSLTIVLLLILVSAASYYRFMVAHDFLVLHDLECDPVLESCFIYCEAGGYDCEEPDYYYLVEREAAELIKLCGSELKPSECDAAYECVLGEEFCETIFCDPEFDLDKGVSMCESQTDNNNSVNNLES